MPSASSAARHQPNTPIDRRRSRRRLRSAPHRLLVGGVGVLVGLSLLFPAQTILAPVADAGAEPGGTCQGWTSTTRPPDYIRVLRNRTGRVDRVPFKQYVVTVLGKEWPAYLPQAVIDAGAVAVKQYAWFHALGHGRVSRHGQCFDVTDGVGDQLYKPGRARVRPDHYTAVNETWTVRLIKNGQLFMTGYRTGGPTACGRDATGWKLFARSAVHCAERGMSYLQILRTYYGPGLNVVSTGSDQSSLMNTPDSTQASDTTRSADSTQPAGTSPVVDSPDASAAFVNARDTERIGVDTDDTSNASSSSSALLDVRAFTTA